MDDERLISVVQNYNYLYDKSAALFRHRDAKENAWSAISEEMQEPAVVCKRRWNCLRERFSREVRQVECSGSGNDVSSTWLYYDAMSFLQPFIKQRRTRGSLNALASDFTKGIPVDGYVLGEEDFEDTTSPAPSNEYKPRVKAWNDKKPVPKRRLSETVDPLHTTTSDQDDSDDNTKDMLYSTKIKTQNTNTSHLPSTAGVKRKAIEISPASQDVDEAFCDALKSFKKLCQTREERKGNEALHGFGQMIISTISGMTARKRTRAMLRMTELLMQIELEPDD